MFLEPALPALAALVSAYGLVADPSWGNGRARVPSQPRASGSSARTASRSTSADLPATTRPTAR